jgi:DNA-binding MarR family transcriptional regulator
MVVTAPSCAIGSARRIIRKLTISKYYQDPDDMSTGIPGADPVERRVGYAVKRLQHALRSAMDEALAPLGLTTAGYAALAALGEAAPAALSNAELARRCFVTPQTMNEVAAGLVRAGLAERQADPEDRRLVRLGLTGTGAAALERAHLAAAAVEARMLTRLDPDRRRDLATALAACLEGLADPSTGSGGAATGR